MISGQKVKLIKQNGEIIDIIASVQEKKILISDIKIPVEEGDVIEKVLQSGIIDNYLITNVVCYDRSLTHYELTYEKQTRLPRRAIENAPITINMHNVSGRVNIASTDNSKNIKITQKDKQIFDDLRAVIQEQISSNEEILCVLDDLEGSYGTDSFSHKYQHFIQTIANHITIIAPFIPALTTMAQ